MRRLGAEIASEQKPPRANNFPERVLRGLLYANGAIGAASGTYVLFKLGFRSPFWALITFALPFLGIVAAFCMSRWPRTALALGAVFYGVQSVAYSSATGRFALLSGLVFRTEIPHGGGVWILNWVGITLTLIHLGALAQRYDPVRIPDDRAPPAGADERISDRPPASDA